MSSDRIASTIDILNKAAGKYEVGETFKNMTSTSYSYSSSDASRSHIRLKMSGGNSKPGIAMPSGRGTMKIPSLLQKLPCRGPTINDSSAILTDGTSAASAFTLSALNVIEKGGLVNDNFEDERSWLSARAEQKSQDLDAIDLDNIKTDDLLGLQAADGDKLRAKYLNKLSRREREHVFQDIHGVADALEEGSNTLFVDDALKKLKAEIDRELIVRNAKKMMDDDTENEINDDCRDKQCQEQQTKPLSREDEFKQSALEEQLGKLQEKLDQLVRQRNNLDSSMKGVSELSSRKQVSAKNHPMFGKLGDIGGFGTSPFGPSSSFSNRSKNNVRPSSVPSSCFGGSSSFFSPTTAMAKSSFSSASISNTNDVQEDTTILQRKDAIAYEQALAQCRGRRRDRNNSLFRPYSTNDKFEDHDVDEDLYIDVEHREFQLSFLRAERFDTKKAATRVIDYFEEKRKLFGVEHLTTKIKLKDLDIQSKNCFESGLIQLLPQRDRAGRAVIVVTQKLNANRDRRQNINSVSRAFWVLGSIALENPETEKNGVVFVKYDIGGARENKIGDWGKVLQALPLRITSMHWCVDTYALKQAAHLSALMLGGSICVRVQCHAGSDMEVQKKLLAFGIPIDIFPVSMNGKMDLLRHRDFLKQQKKAEASTLLNKALALVEAPMLEDIVLDVVDVEKDLDTNIVAPSSTGSNRDAFPTAGNNFRQNQLQLQQELKYPKQQQELNLTGNDFGFNNSNKMSSLSFNDSLCFTGNRNPMQVQTAMQQQYQQQQQRLDSFSQQHTGMNLNMGMIQQFSQNQQHRNSGITESKSGIAYSMEPVLVPGELDILLGRGRGAQNHKGNIHYRQVVETFRSRYEQIPQKGAKTQLIREVVAVIYDNGGRFLKQDGFGRWIPVDPEVARDKVSHSFRNQKRLQGTPTNGESPSKKRPRE